MMTFDREALLAVLAEAIPRPGRDEIELSVCGGHHQRLTLQDGDLGEVLQQDRTFARARSVRAEGPWVRMGTAQTNDFSSAGLAAATRLAQSLRPTGTRIAGPDGVAIAGHYASTAQTLTGARDPATALAGPGLLLNALAPLAYQSWRDPTCRVSAVLDVWHGAFDVDGVPEVLALSNTWGMRAAHLATTVRLRVTAASGQQPPVSLTIEGRALADCDSSALLDEAWTLAQAPVASDETGRLPNDAFVLMPDVVAAVVRATLPAFSRRLVESGASWISPRLRVPLAASGVDLLVDPTDPRVLQRPFDGEGVPSRACTLVAAGAQADLLVGRGDLADVHRSDGYSPAHPTLLPPVPWTAILRLTDEPAAPSPADFAARLGRHVRILALQDVHMPVLGSADLVARTAGVFLYEGATCLMRLPDRVVAWNGFAVLLRVVAGSAPVYTQRMAVPALLLQGAMDRIEAPRP